MANDKNKCTCGCCDKEINCADLIDDTSTLWISRKDKCCEEEFRQVPIKCLIDLIKDSIGSSNPPTSTDEFFLSSSIEGNDIPSLQKAMAAAHSAGQILKIDKEYISTSNVCLTIPSDGKVVGSETGSIKAGFLMAHLIKFEVGGSNQEVKNLKLDGNNLTTSYLITGTGNTNPVIEGNEFCNWRRAIRIESMVGKAAENPLIKDNFIHTPATSNVVLPVLVSASFDEPSVLNAMLEGNRIKGAGAGAFSTTNQFTGDMLELQNIDGGYARNNIIEDSGENGIAVARLTRNFVSSDNQVFRSDKHGFQIGSGFQRINYTPTNGQVIGGESVSFSGGKSGIVQIQSANVQGTFVVTSATGRIFDGETFTTASGATGTITTVTGSDNNTFINNRTINSGLNPNVNLAHYKLIYALNTRLVDNFGQSTPITNNQGISLSGSTAHLINNTVDGAVTQLFVDTASTVL